MLGVFKAQHTLYQNIEQTLQEAEFKTQDEKFALYKPDVQNKYVQFNPFNSYTMERLNDKKNMILQYELKLKT